MQDLLVPLGPQLKIDYRLLHLLITLSFVVKLELLEDTWAAVIKTGSSLDDLDIDFCIWILLDGFYFAKHVHLVV